MLHHNLYNYSYNTQWYTHMWHNQLWYPEYNYAEILQNVILRQMSYAFENGYEFDYNTMQKHVLDFLDKEGRYPCDNDINQPWSILVDRIEENDMPDVWRAISSDSIWTNSIIS